MLLSIQQKYLLNVIQKLGCARREQLDRLFCPAFCADYPDTAEKVIGASLRRLRTTCQQLRETDGVFHLTNTKPDSDLLEAIDVMIELSRSNPLDFRRAEPPVLLRFSVQEFMVRRFAILRHGAVLDVPRFGVYERVILLFDGWGQARPLPVSNKQFVAVRQGAGSHRYFALGGSQGGSYYAQKENSTE